MMQIFLISFKKQSKNVTSATPVHSDSEITQYLYMQRSRSRDARECLRKSAVSLHRGSTPTLMHVNNYTKRDKLCTTQPNPANDMINMWYLSGISLFTPCITMSATDISNIFCYKCDRARIRSDSSPWNKLGPLTRPETDTVHTADSRHRLWCLPS